MTNPTTDQTIAYVALFHVTTPSARTGAGLADELEASVDAVMSALLDLETSEDEDGRHTDSAAVALDTLRSAVEIEIRAHGPAVETAEHHAWTTIVKAVVASGGQVVTDSPVPDHPPEMLFEYIRRGSHRDAEEQFA